MWALMLGGGGIVVMVLGPISVPDHGVLDPIILSGAKAAIATALVVAWVFVLTKVKDRIFRRGIRA